MGKKVLEALDTLSSRGWAERWVKAINLLQAQRGWIAKIASKNLWNLRGNEYSEAAAGWLHVLAWNVLGIVFRCFAGEWSCIPKEKLAQVLLCHSCLWRKSGVPSGKISFSLSLPFFWHVLRCSFARRCSDTFRETLVSRGWFYCDVEPKDQSTEPCRLGSRILIKNRLQVSDLWYWKILHPVTGDLSPAAFGSSVPT